MFCFSVSCTIHLTRGHSCFKTSFYIPQGWLYTRITAVFVKGVFYVRIFFMSIGMEMKVLAVPFKAQTCQRGNVQGVRPTTNSNMF